MDTKSYYVLVQIAPNLSTYDRVSIGLIGFDENNIKVKFSSERQYIVKKLLGSGDTIIDDIVSQIEQNLLESPNKLQERITTKGIEHNWTANYLTYLQTYSNGTLRFSDTILVAEALTEEIFNRLFDKLLGKNMPEISAIVNTERIPINKEENRAEKIISDYKDSFTYDGHILEKMYYSLKRFEDIPYLPSFFVRGLYPFQDDSSYISNFSLFTKNTAIFDFFNNIIESHQEKIMYVISSLRNALIFNITFYNSNSFDTKIAKIESPEEKCNCIICSYNRYNLPDAVHILKEVNADNESDNIKNAYAHFWFGNYITSYKLFWELAQEFVSKNRYFKAFICLYNIKKLRNHIKNSCFFVICEGKNKILHEIDSIDKKRILQQINWGKDNKCQELIDWIQNEKFIYEYFKEITNLSDEIIKLYHQHENGGSSINDFVYVLRTKLLELHIFYTGNHIILEDFKEFHHNFDKATEALIASHAIDNENKQRRTASKLVSFDSFLLELICNYNEPEKLLKYLNKYNIKNIQVNKNINDFLDKLENLFSSKHNLTELILNLKEGENNKFFYKIDRIINNILILLSGIELEKDKIVFFIELILNFLIQNKLFLNANTENYLHIFIFKKKKYFQDEKLSGLLFNLLKLFLIESTYIGNNLNLIVKIVDIITTYQPNIRIDRIDLTQSIINLHAEKDVQLLVYIYPLFTAELQGFLQESLEKSLEKNFNALVCYEAIVNGILSLENYVNFFYEQNAFEYLIALAYQYNLSTDTDNFKSIAEKSYFHAWLVYPEIFDYSKFDIEWLNQIHVYVLFEKIGKLESVRNELVIVIKQTGNERLKEIYFQYFV